MTMLGAASALCTVLLLAGCSGEGSARGSGTAAPTGATTSSPAATTAPTTRADVFSLSVGDCLNDTSETRVSDVPTVDCTTPHDLEVFYDFALADADAYPGAGPIQDAAETGCTSQFASYVGLEYDKSILAFTEYVPTESSWEEGDRTVTCVLGDPNGTSTGSLRGAAH